MRHMSATSGSNRPNHVVGEIKVSWKWSSILADEGLRTSVQQYTQVLSQLHFYMLHQGTRDGYVLTDTALVCVHRPGTEYGVLEVGIDTTISKHPRFRKEL
jgi:hypothetical protein